MNSLQEDSQETERRSESSPPAFTEGQRREEEGLRAAGTTSLKVTTRFPDYRGYAEVIMRGRHP